jgi:hypothetical protein
MADLIRCGSFSYNLILKDHRVVPLERFIGFNEMYNHLAVLNQIKREEEEEKRQNKINITPTPE